MQGEIFSIIYKDNTMGIAHTDRRNLKDLILNFNRLIHCPSLTDHRNLFFLQNRLTHTTATETIFRIIQNQTGNIMPASVSTVMTSFLHNAVSYT